MHPRVFAAALAALLLAGCAAPAVEPETAAPLAAAPVFSTLATGAGCRWFCEPSVAIDTEGRWFVLGDSLRVSEDGGATFADLRVPRNPIPVMSFQTDSMVAAAPDGSLWYSALVAACPWVTCSPYLLTGIQVARSDDAGATWDSTYLSLPTHPKSPGADRQWLSFAPDGTVCVSFQYVGPVLSPLPLRPEAPSVRVSCSSDGVHGFGDFVSASGDVRYPVINGRPVFDAEGRMFIPYFRYDEEPPLHVAVSEDRGRTFESRAVGGTGAWFPALAVDAQGRLHMAWNAEGSLMHATSGDQGATWSAPALLSAPGEEIVSSPWLEARGEGVVALWFSKQADETNTLVLHDGANRTALAEGLPNGDFRYAATDFAHFALDADGKVVAVFGDLDEEDTRLAVEG